MILDDRAILKAAPVKAGQSGLNQVQSRNDKFLERQIFT
jgi:hypothetical protein